jgi:dihydrofolate synthase / folylpolyglutamate synthase
VAELRAALAAAAIDLTHFEFSTLLAFEWFARIGVDVAVVEVGLGGRLDATNLVAPLVTAITSIGRDHEEFLGSDLAGIAREKAGIAKAGVPLVVGPVAPDLAAVIRARAETVGAPVVSATLDASLAETAGGLAYRGPGDVAWDGLRLALAGRFQLANAQTALTVLACARATLPVGATAVHEGLATTWWPGRLAVVREAPRVVADGAHNPDRPSPPAGGLPALLGARPTTLVFSVMADKAWRAMLDLLVPYATRVVATRVGRRGLDPAQVAETLAGRMPVDVVYDAPAAIRGALAATPPDGAVLIAGSLFLVGEAYAILGDGAPLVAPWQGWDRIGTQARP